MLQLQLFYYYLSTINQAREGQRREQQMMQPWHAIPLMTHTCNMTATLCHLHQFCASKHRLLSAKALSA